MEKVEINLKPVTIQRTTDVHERYGTDESVPYAKPSFYELANPGGC